MNKNCIPQLGGLLSDKGWAHKLLLSHGPQNFGESNGLEQFSETPIESMAMTQEPIYWRYLPCIFGLFLRPM